MKFKVLKNGYRINVTILRWFTLFVLVYGCFAGYQILSHDKYYIVNPLSVSVSNPVYGEDFKVIPDHIESMKELPPNFEAGYNHGFFVADASKIILVLLALFGVFNHFKYNTGFN